MTEIQKRAYAILKTRGPMRCSDLGWELWGDSTEAPGRGTGSHQQNKFCRVAGKVLNALWRQRKAEWRPKKHHSEWYAL